VGRRFCNNCFKIYFFNSIGSIAFRAASADAARGQCRTLCSHLEDKAAVLEKLEQAP
jgi:hypothetical protein